MHVSVDQFVRPLLWNSESRRPAARISSTSGSRRQIQIFAHLWRSTICRRTSERDAGFGRRTTISNGFFCLLRRGRGRAEWAPPSMVTPPPLPPAAPANPGGPKSSLAIPLWGEMELNKWDHLQLLNLINTTLRRVTGYNSKTWLPVKITLRFSFLQTVAHHYSNSVYVFVMWPDTRRLHIKRQKNPQTIMYLGSAGGDAAGWCFFFLFFSFCFWCCRWSCFTLLLAALIFLSTFHPNYYCYYYK